MVSRDVRSSTHGRSATQVLVSAQMLDAALELWVFAVSQERYYWQQTPQEHLQELYARSYKLAVGIRTGQR